MRYLFALLLVSTAANAQEDPSSSTAFDVGYTIGILVPIVIVIGVIIGVILLIKKIFKR